MKLGIALGVASGVAAGSTPGVTLSFGRRAERYADASVRRLNTQEATHYSDAWTRYLLEKAHDIGQHENMGTLVIMEGAIPKPQQALEREAMDRIFDRAVQQGQITEYYDWVFSSDNTVCAERLALSTALEAATLAGKPDAKVDAMFLDISDSFRDDVHSIGSCSHCLDAFNNSEAVTSNTLLVNPKQVRDPHQSPTTQPNHYIEVRTIGNIMPYKAEEQDPKPSTTVLAFQDLPILATPEGARILRAQNIPSTDYQSQLQPLLDHAKHAYQVSKAAGLGMRNGQSLGTAALFINENGDQVIAEGASLVFTKRYFAYADVNAIRNGLISVGENGTLAMRTYPNSDQTVQAQDLVAIFYYSDDVLNPVRQFQLEPIRKYVGHSDIALLSLRDDTLNIRGMTDYTKVQYIKYKDLPNTETDTPEPAASA